MSCFEHKSNLTLIMLPVLKPSAYILAQLYIFIEILLFNPHFLSKEMCFALQYMYTK